MPQQCLPCASSPGRRCGGKGCAVRSDGKTVLISNLPVRWQGQTSTLWCKETLAGARQVPSQSCLVLVASVPAAGVSWAGVIGVSWAGVTREAKAAAEGLFSTQPSRTEREFFLARCCRREVVTCWAVLGTGKVLCRGCSLLGSRQGCHCWLACLFWLLKMCVNIPP